ncbi:2-hydroxychromene-2-carboxylate isomerase [Marinibaculum pumilum]|uniref:2-hydroxychromene-2-carboxylate isomerase n=1 Tax=Marinibaculum pumilum TaxID=1766165 RepID=A0ABV7L312_9PROT
MAEIEYFYSAHSAFAYLGSARFLEIAQAAGRRIHHRPMDLDQLMVRIGAVPMAERGPVRRGYFFGREIERWSEERNAPVTATLPAGHRKDQTLPNAVLIAALQAGRNVDALAHAMLQAHWRDDVDLTEPGNLEPLIRGAGLDPAALLAAAGTDAVLAKYRANTDEAVERGVFGAPTYFVDGDMFYGQDRLEQVEKALRKPYRKGFYGGGGR